MNNKDRMTLCGIFKFYEYDLLGRLVFYLEEPNIVVNRAKYNLARVLGNTNISSRYISCVAFGTGGLDQNGNPVPPSENDLELENEIISKNVNEPEYPDDVSVTFTATLGLTEGNGYAFSEAGLKFANGDLCARKTFTARTKSDTNTFTVVWRIYWL